MAIINNFQRHFWSNYRGRSIGRLMDVMKFYASGMYYDTVTFNNGEIFYYKKLFATYSWFSETDIPVFDFKGEWSFFNMDQLRKFEHVLFDFEEAPWKVGDDFYEVPFNMKRYFK